MSCIIHYVELPYEETLFPVSDTIKSKILLAKTAHISKQTHLDQCNSIPEIITDSYFHRKCYNKFVKIVEKTATNLKTNENKSIAKHETRSKRTLSTLNELEPRKRQRVNLVKSVRRSNRSSELTQSTSRNKFVFGKNCVLCEKFELRYKNKNREDVREYPMNLTLDAAAQNLITAISTKEKYKELRDRTQWCLEDLIAAEFKYHDRCRKELIREDRETSFVCRPPSGFVNVKEFVDDNILTLNQVVSIDSLYDLCFDKSGVNKDTIKKRKHRLRNIIKNKYGSKTTFIDDGVNPGLLMNTKALDSKARLNENNIITVAYRTSTASH